MLALGTACGAPAQIYTGTQIGKNGGLDAYHLSIGNYFNVSEKQIAVCAQRNITDEELPVVFFIAQKAGQTPETVAGLRSGGMSWMGIARHFNLSPRAFYVPAGGKVTIKPYKTIYASFANRPRVRLTDADIVNLVNLKFMSNHYGREPREIMQMRGAGKTFPDIDDTFRQTKEDMAWEVDDAPVVIRDSKGRPDPLKGNKNALNSDQPNKNP